MSTSTHLITYEESLLMPESNLEEVVDGELITIPPATKNHSSIVEFLHLTFLRQMSQHLRFTPGAGFLLKRDPFTYRIPDLAIVDRLAWKKDLRATSDPYSRVIPEIVIEIVSPANQRHSSAASPGLLRVRNPGSPALLSRGAHLRKLSRPHSRAIRADGYRHASNHD